MTTTRRDVLRLAGRLGAAGAVAGLGSYGAWLSHRPATAGHADLLGRPLRIGYLPITDASALLTAHHHGYFHDAGLPAGQPTLFRSWEALAQAFVVGEVDVVHLLMPLAIQLKLAARAPVTVVGWGHTNGSALTVAPEITRTEQLAGTTFAIPSWWSVHSVLLQRILRDAGLRPVVRESAGPGTVELVVMPPAEMVTALAGGTISGYVVADPFNAAAEVQGIGRIHRFLGDVWHDHACCAVVVRDELIDDHPEAVSALLQGVLRAQQWLDGNRPEAAGVLHETYLPQPLPAIDKVFTRTPADYGGVIRNPDWQGERLGFTPFPQPSYTRELASLMQQTLIDGETGFLSSIDPAEVHDLVVDDSFIREALTSQGQSIVLRTEELSS